MSEDLYTLPQECDFSAAGNNSSSKYDCSPKLKDEFFSPFQGLLINAASETELPVGLTRESIQLSPAGDAMDGNNIMVTGLIKLPPSAYVGTGHEVDPAYHVVLVAVDNETAQTYSGTMVRFGFQAPGPDIPPPAVDQPESDTWEYFNIDLIQNLDIPLHPAGYTVYATLGNHKSNVLNISVSFK